MPNAEEAVCFMSGPRFELALTQSAHKKFAELPFGRIKHFLAFFVCRILAPSTASLSFHFDGEIAFLQTI